MTISRTLHAYLRGSDFKRKLIRRYERFEILCEADLRTAVASLLRTKLRGIGGKAEKYKYRVTCEKRVAGVIADILIWRGKNPRFWIELKDTGRFRKALAEADWKKLQAFAQSAQPSRLVILSTWLVSALGERLEDPQSRGRALPFVFGQYRLFLKTVCAWISNRGTENTKGESTMAAENRWPRRRAPRGKRGQPFFWPCFTDRDSLIASNSGSESKSFGRPAARFERINASREATCTCMP